MAFKLSKQQLAVRDALASSLREKAAALNAALSSSRAVPWVSATKPPETSWPRRKTALIFAGDLRLITHTISVIRRKATAMPAKGAISEGFNTFCPRFAHCTTDQPSDEELEQ